MRDVNSVSRGGGSKLYRQEDGCKTDLKKSRESESLRLRCTAKCHFTRYHSEINFDYQIPTSVQYLDTFNQPKRHMSTALLINAIGLSFRRPRIRTDALA